MSELGKEINRLAKAKKLSMDKSSRGPLEEAVIKVLKEEFNDIVDVDKLNNTIDNKLHILKSDLESQLDSQINELKNRKDDSPRPIEISITNGRDDKEIKLDIGVQHKEFPTLVKLMSIRNNVYIYGPTGSGKSKAAIIAAKEVFKLPVYIQAVYPQAPTSLLMGYNTASGSYCEGIAYKPFKDGGILVIDELDNGSAASNLAINMLTNDVCFFPNGMVERHKDFFIVATANTIGNGADRKYIGRSMQDKALLNRFVYLQWEYDLKFEKALAMAEYQRWGGKDLKMMSEHVEAFWKTRKACEDLAIDHILSPRNLIEHVARMVATGVDINTISKSCIVRGLEIDQWRKIREKARLTEDVKPDDYIDSQDIQNGPKRLAYDNPFDKKKDEDNSKF